MALATGTIVQALVNVDIAVEAKVLVALRTGNVEIGFIPCKEFAVIKGT